MNRLLAVIMAGGRSERMQVTGVGTHKAFAKVGGVTLLERCVRRLLNNGLREIVVVSSANVPSISAAVRNELSTIARQYSANLSNFLETRPLGTVGVVRLLTDERTDILVTNVDNFTSLNEAALLKRHRESGAVMTLATHVLSMVSPFGEVDVSNGFVSRYREKPSREVQVCSGSCLVSPLAAAAIPPDRPCGVNELCEVLLSRRLTVAAYCHEEPWVDVNDALALREAERMFAQHSTHFQ